MRNKMNGDHRKARKTEKGQKKLAKLGKRWERKANKGEMVNGEMTSKKDIRRSNRSKRKILNAKGSPREEKVTKKYGYDMKTARKEGMKRDATTGHMASNSPSGKVLKGKKHTTAYKARKVDRALGYTTKKKDGDRYITKKKWNK